MGCDNCCEVSIQSSSHARYSPLFSWVVASIIESFQVHYEITKNEERSKIHQDIDELNRIFSLQLNFNWKAKFKRRFRSAMQTMYNDEQVEDHVIAQLGTPQEATKTARSSLFQLVGGKEIYLPPSAIKGALTTIPKTWLVD